MLTIPLMPQKRTFTRPSYFADSKNNTGNTEQTTPTTHFQNIAQHHKDALKHYENGDYAQTYDSLLKAQREYTQLNEAQMADDNHSK